MVSQIKQTFTKVTLNFHRNWIIERRDDQISLYFNINPNNASYSGRPVDCDELVCTIRIDALSPLNTKSYTFPMKASSTSNVFCDRFSIYDFEETFMLNTEVS